MSSSLFQSEEMTLCQLFLQSEAAYNCVSELGELGLAQFRDLNPDVNAFQRKFVNEVRRCDEMERKLRYLDKEIKKDGIPMLDTGENPEAPQPREMIDMEATYEKLENEFREVNQNAETLRKNFLELTELKHILRKTQVFFDETGLVTQMVGGAVQQLSPEEEERIGLLSEEGIGRASVSASSMKLGFVAGVILRERLPAFERLLWRACRGNVFLRQSEIETPLEDPITGDQVNKVVFIIFFQGDQLKTRVKKICEGFRATLYPCPETPAERRQVSIEVMTRIEDLTTILSQTNDHRHRVLVAAAKSIKHWFIKVRKIKAIYHTLNLFNLDVTQKCLIAECWIPVRDLELIHASLRKGTERAGSSVPPILNRMDSEEDPPTYFRLNKVTRGFQNLVDSYGIASYREVNPAPYTIITFPFLFAVMFGDSGHALLMLLFGLWMVVTEKKHEGKKGNEIWKIFFGGRYIILLMGIFSFYTGLIYNDVFSKSLNIFGSYWYANKTTEFLMNSKDVMLDPKDCYYQHPYPIGVDPVWQVAVNKIAFLNAYKMKISIITGVIHMLFGVLLSVWNHVYFKRTVNIICEFIPQLIFMLFLFLYLCILVFHKWIWYGPRGGNDSGPFCAPSILITFINMVLFKAADKAPAGCTSNLLYPGQEIVQKVLVVSALACVPWMLFIKPFVLKKQWKAAQAKKEGHLTAVTTEHEEDEDEETPNGRAQSTDEAPNATTEAATTDNANARRPSAAHGGAHGHGHGDEFEMSEVMIHQGIHTIEYVLGSVSHTASYLRLWALSLAHAQLSEVLWSMVMRIGLAQTQWWGGIILYFIFTAWSVLTVSILVLMEGLSAFLHTLRLHWVEFQSKFYVGQGYPFHAFSFKEMLAAAEELED